jgi:hypothetical protein
MEALYRFRPDLAEEASKTFDKCSTFSVIKLMSQCGVLTDDLLSITLNIHRLMVSTNVLVDICKTFDSAQKTFPEYAYVIESLTRGVAEAGVSTGNTIKEEIKQFVQKFTEELQKSNSAPKGRNQHH